MFKGANFVGVRDFRARHAARYFPVAAAATDQLQRLCRPLGERRSKAPEWPCRWLLTDGNRLELRWNIGELGRKCCRRRRLAMTAALVERINALEPLGFPTGEQDPALAEDPATAMRNFT